ncbi:DUF4230 domain-containing protein [Edaphobacillus lindanitolerans]|uniref:DUF4230 domain-containing protein n=1 Tax=Edaphobacillus lindanitolerans TaxID=550447 RepID=A0A1U7PHW2_9BACI|nr:DUF4230 domain-containing protein [Edaphobacillus lindanitolerans]SIT70090.1 Protein of unknown function [Edaphobacillus lindanitolerans]
MPKPNEKRGGRPGSEEESAVTVDEVWDGPATKTGAKDGSGRRRAFKTFLWIAVPLLALVLILPILALRLLAGGSTFMEQKGAVVQRVQELKELATAEAYTKVIIERSDNELFGQSIGIDIPGTKRNLLVVLPGSVKAGIDFGKVGEKDIRVDQEAETVRIEVPKPEFLGKPEIRFDEAQIYSQEGLFRAKADIREGYDLAEEAQSLIIKEATEQGVLETARKNAESTLKEMFSFAGYDVEVTFKE